MRSRLTMALAALCWAAPAFAGNIDKALAKLDPEERARQACAILGLDQLRRDKQLPKADRLQASAGEAAAFTDNMVVASSGAVRAKDRWYALNFTCTVTPDRMKATNFAYKLGAEIPEDQWEDKGLWR